MNYIIKRQQIFEFSSYRRGVAENFEKDLVNYLNRKVDIVPSNVKIVADQIMVKFPTMIDAQHIGSKSYNIEGDILLITPDKPINLEIKMSDSYGKGTLANTSQKLFQAINPSIMGYQDFHNNYIFDDKPLKQFCWDLVGDKVGKKIKNNADYQRTLRTLRDSNSDIIGTIVDITNKIKIEYNEYVVDEIKNTPDYLYKLTYLVRLLKDGIHTFADIKKALSEFRAIDEYKSRSKYYVVYVYNASSDTTSQIVDYSKALDTVTSIDANGQSIILRNKDNQIILRFSTHWKNICQGGATPCFNVFHGSIDLTQFLL